MATTGDVNIDEGTATHLPTYEITEDAETKNIPRSALNDSTGAEIGIAAKPVQVSVANTGANATAVKTDSSATTQPVSGTVTVADGVDVDVATIADTAIDVNSGVKSAGTQRVVLATDQPALTNKLLVTPDLPSGAATAAKQPALGTAGTASADVITVQGKASMTPVLVDASATTQPISGSVTATQGTATNLKAQAEAYQGGSAVASGNPLEVNLRSSTVSVATSTKQSDGSQRSQVVDGSGNVIGATSNALDINIKSGNPTSITANAGTNLNTSALALEAGNIATVAGAVTTAKMQVQQNAATLPTPTTMQNAATASGNGTNLPVTGYAAAVLNIVSSPAMSGGTTVNFEASVDDTTFVAIGGHQIGVAGSLATTTTADGDFRLAVSGYKSIRARISAYSAGTVTIKGYVSPLAPAPTAIALATGSNTIGALTANQSINNAQVSGTAVDTNSGTKSAGTQRVVLATDQPTMTNAQPVTLTSTTVTGTVAVTESGTWTIGSSTATGSAVPANSFYNGGIAKTALPSAATDGNLTGLMSDKYGRLVVVNDAIRDIVSMQITTISASTSETTVGTAVASTFLDLTSILISNTSATAARVDFRDTTGGTVLFSIYTPAGDTRGIVFHTPVPQTTVNTNWTAQSSASVTDLRVFMKWIKNK